MNSRVSGSSGLVRFFFLLLSLGPPFDPLHFFFFLSRIPG